MEVQDCPTEQMIGDFSPKRSKERNFSSSEKLLLVNPVSEPSKECVGLRMVK
jgi:hypothetical protein